MQPVPAAELIPTLDCHTLLEVNDVLISKSGNTTCIAYNDMILNACKPSDTLWQHAPKRTTASSHWRVPEHQWPLDDGSTPELPSGAWIWDASTYGQSLFLSLQNATVVVLQDTGTPSPEPAAPQLAVRQVLKLTNPVAMVRLCPVHPNEQAARRVLHDCPELFLAGGWGQRVSIFRLVDDEQPFAYREAGSVSTSCTILATNWVRPKHAREERWFVVAQTHSIIVCRYEMESEEVSVLHTMDKDLSGSVVYALTPEYVCWSSSAGMHMKRLEGGDGDDSDDDVRTFCVGGDFVTPIKFIVACGDFVAVVHESGEVVLVDPAAGERRGSVVAASRFVELPSLFSAKYLEERKQLALVLHRFGPGQDRGGLMLIDLPLFGKAHKLAFFSAFECDGSALHAIGRHSIFDRNVLGLVLGFL